MKHISVFNNEAIEWLNIDPNGTYVDTTLGAGGHSRAILKALEGGDGQLISFDFDPAAVEAFSAWLEGNSKQAKVVNANFATLQDTLKAMQVQAADGILADLGWSSDQLTHIPGLSYMRTEDALDMRLDSSLTITASQLLNNLNRKELLELFQSNSDLDRAEAEQLIDRVIARRPLEWRVASLNEIIAEVNSRRKHNLQARAYQALRIKVNSEVENLQAFLTQATELLKPAARLVIITFHSLEERILTEFMQKQLPQSTFKNLINVNMHVGLGHLRPTVAELRANIHAHSAKLWAFAKK
jgi:16S rRNA (cytosine1402-N4)-methyltransferase